MAQLSSSSSEEVLAGLQTIAFLNDPVARSFARPRVEALTKSNDDRVAQQALATLSRLDAAIAAEPSSGVAC
jgi:hypothetical protein